MLPEVCSRHGGHCVYTGTEPDRCPRCHRSWSKVATDVIDGRLDTRELHEARHDREDAKRARSGGSRRPVAASAGERPEQVPV